MHLQSVITWLDVVEVSVRDTKRTFCATRAKSTQDVQNVGRASQVAWVLQHRLKSRLCLDALADLHPTVAGTQHHDDVIAMATRLERFAGAIFGDAVACVISKQRINSSRHIPRSLI